MALLFRYLFNVLNSFICLQNVKNNNAYGNESDRRYLNVSALGIIYRLVESKKDIKEIKEVAFRLKGKTMIMNFAIKKKKFLLEVAPEINLTYKTMDIIH